MTYELAIGDRTYSSWSLRGWLLLEKFNLPFRERRARLYLPEFDALLAEFAPATLVPAMRLPSGFVVSDTLAIAETLNERHPEAQMWPGDADHRAFARSIVAEMHAGFSAVRAECPMNLRCAYTGFEPGDAVLKDLKRAALLWETAIDRANARGPWLFGTYSIADAFFAPFAARIASYDLPVTGRARAYVDSHLADPAFRRWRAMGLAQNYRQKVYDIDLPETKWRGPPPIGATSTHRTDAENGTCPYSGDPASYYLDIDGRIFGFCNPFCRDKTLHDPAAWPAFMNLYKK